MANFIEVKYETPATILKSVEFQLQLHESKKMHRNKETLMY